MARVEGWMATDLLASPSVRVMGVACTENELQTLGLHGVTPESVPVHMLSSV